MRWLWHSLEKWRNRLLAMAILGFAMGGLAALADPALPPWRADRILVKPKAGHDAAAFANLKQRQRLQLYKAYADLEHLEVLKLPPGASVPNVLAALQASGLVEFAEPDFRVRATLLAPDDPQYADGTQWNLNNLSGTGDINAPQGWGIQSTASNVVVAIVDSGIRLTHRDLAPNLWRNPREIAGNGLDDDGNGLVDDVYGINAVGSPNTTNVTDDVGHGTHVAGIIGAVGNNGLGVAGVAWRVQLMACKFLDSTGNGYISDAVECFDYARLNGAKIINASFGSTNYSSALDAAVNACRSAGIIVVASAGNDGANNDTTGSYPANLGVVYGRDNVVAVAATDRYDQLAYFSNYGSNNVHLAAPGYAVYSTYFSSDDSYTYLSGTSMAAPHVSGALALMRARYPLENYQQLIKRLLEAVDVVPALAGRCRTSGRLNLYQALANYQILTNAYNWVTVSNAATLTLANDGVSAALPLPFPFNFYGQNYSRVYVGANGLLGFINDRLTTAANTDLSGANGPFAVICPFWDDLNPANSGTVTYGTNGVAPNRQVVVSWNAVPRAASSSTKLTFQALLDESSQRVVVQYLEVQPNKILTGGGGRSATVGIRSHDGVQAARYTVNGSPYVLANRTAFAFVPLAAEALAVLPGAHLIASGPTGGPFLPASADYVVTNQGNTILNWQAVPSKDWISLTTTGGVLTAGQSASLNVSLNTNAALLPAGLHSATISFRLATNAEPIAVRSVSLTVIGTNAALAVTPASDVAASGFTGGPFTPGSALYTLVNPGDAQTTWAAASSEPWLTLSPTNAALAPNASAVVLAAINPSANHLPAGNYTSVIQFLNLTTGNGSTTRVFTLQISQRPGILAVTPAAGFAVSGVVGEPFAPASMVYVLTNAGEDLLEWQATVSQPWMDLAPTNGVLAPGQSAECTLSLNAGVETLQPDTYYATLEFLNVTTGAGNTTRAISLQVNPKPGKLLVLPETASLTFTGLVGGPIAFTNQSLVLTNAGGTNLFWSAADEQGWLIATPPDGALAAAESADLLIALSSNAFTLVEGRHTNTLRILAANGTNGVHEIAFILDLAPPPATNAVLEVLPATNRFALAGYAGGPVGFTNQTLLLTNAGGANLVWTMSQSSDWLQPSLTNGTLLPGETTNLVVALATNALTLPPGAHTNLLTLTPEPGVPREFEFTLELLPPPLLTASQAEGGLELQLPALSGRLYFLDTSTNLLDWMPFATNVSGADGWLRITNATDQTWQFFRVRVE